MNSLAPWLVVSSLLLCGCGSRSDEGDAPARRAATSGQAPNGAEAGVRLGPADVSVLFPDVEELWPASLETASGPLLPAERFAVNARSLTRELADELEYGALRVVAMRFDPCFQRAVGGPCEPQIRLVLQVRAELEGRVVFLDGAVHALYALTPEAFAAAVEALVELVGGDGARGALDVHPRLVREGMAGPFAIGLRAIAREYLGPKTLTRVTFMTRTTAPAGQWQFSGFEYLDFRDDPDGPATKLPIAGIGVTMQNVTRERGTPEADHVFVYTVHPLFAEREGRRGSSGLYLADLSADARAEVHAWALRQESPASHVPDSTDCASCHLANHIGRRLEDLSPELARGGPDRVVKASERDADNLRAFGWFGDEPMVAMRTANETAAVLERLGRERTRWFVP